MCFPTERTHQLLLYNLLKSNKLQTLDKVKLSEYLQTTLLRRKFMDWCTHIYRDKCDRVLFFVGIAVLVKVLIDACTHE